jgi:purine-nucleoside phosphorylase
MYQQAQAAADYINELFSIKSDIALVTGSGLDGITEQYTIIQSISFADIPHLNAPTFHKGELILAQSGDKTFYILKGRLHYYEGFSVQEVTFPIRILHLLGVQSIIMTNASGGLNPDYNPGDIMLVRDHINLFPENPLRGPNDDRFGIRFPDMSDAYSARLRDIIKTIPDININEGIYVGFPGPSLETPAEYRYLHIIGGDAVGMSTVTEVIVANHCGMEVVVLSVTTNICYPPEQITPTTLEEVIAMANKAVPGLKIIVDRILAI